MTEGGNRGPCAPPKNEYIEEMESASDQPQVGKFDRKLELYHTASQRIRASSTSLLRSIQQRRPGR